MSGTRSSVAIILSVGGATLDSGALARMPGARLVRAEFATGEQAACVAATVEHECETGELLRRLRPWAAGRGWSVTVAPLPRPG
jgi:hypothetical protein